MTLNYVIPSNIILEVIMIGVEAAAFAHAYEDQMYARIDQIYLGVVVPFLIFSCAWAFYFKTKERYYRGWNRGLRITQGVVLFIIGCTTVSSAKTIESSSLCYPGCQLYEAKVAAGILAVVNSLFYFIRPCKLKLVPIIIPIPNNHPQFVMTPMNYIEPPPSYFPQQQPPIQMGYYAYNHNNAVPLQQTMQQTLT